MSSEAEDAILKAKDNLPEVTPTPPAQQKPQSSPQALKERLEGGEPGFTIIDVRDRMTFNKARIMGAMAMPMEQLVERVKNSGGLTPEREIYICGESDEQASEAVANLREAGFTEVSAIQGGLAGWKEIGGPTEGTEEQGEKVVGKGAYNLADRLKEQQEIQDKHD